MQITRYRGDTGPDEILISKDGVAVNLTGSTVYLTLNSTKNPTDTSNQIYQLTGVSSDPTTGVVKFTPSESNADRVGLFYYDIQIVDAQSNKITVVKDTYQYIQDITKN